MSKSFEDIIKPLTQHLSMDDHISVLKLARSIRWEKATNTEGWKKNSIDNATRANKLREKLLSLIKDEEGTTEADDAIYEAIQQIVHEYPQNNNKQSENNVTIMDCPIDFNTDDGKITLTGNPAVRSPTYAYSCVSGNIYHKPALIDWLTRSNTDPVNRAPYSPFELRKLGASPEVLARITQPPAQLNYRMRYALSAVWMVLFDIAMITLYIGLTGDWTNRYGDHRAIGQFMGLGFSAAVCGTQLYFMLTERRPITCAISSFNMFLVPFALLMYGSLGWNMGDMLSTLSNPNAALGAEVATSFVLALYAGYYALRLCAAATALNPEEPHYNPMQSGVASHQAWKSFENVLFPAIMSVLSYVVTEMIINSIVDLPSYAGSASALIGLMVGMAGCMYRHSIDPIQREVLRFSDSRPAAAELNIQHNAHNANQPLLQHPR